jgi:hypothetical protein
MKAINQLVIPSLMAVLLLASSGCTPKEEAEGLPSAPGSTGEAVSIESVTENKTVPSSPDAVTPPQAIPAIDFAQAERPINAQGNAMSDLEYLNHLVEQVNESRVSDIEIKQKAFKTEAEQVAYEEAEQQKRKGPIRDLNELVTAGVLKALPTAPGGQRYTIDATTGKVVLQ